MSRKFFFFFFLFVYMGFIKHAAFVGRDFDFSGNTQRFSTGISEEEAFFARRKQQEEQGKYIITQWD